MKDVSRTFSWMSGIAGAGASAAALELLNKYLPNVSGALRIVITALVSMAALFVIQLTLNRLPGWRWGRSLLLGSSSIEGWWYLQTFNDSTGHAIPPGLMLVTYKVPSLEPHITVYRQPQRGSTSGFAPLMTRSYMTAFREDDRHLLNYCIFPEEKGEGRSLGVGNFSSEGSSDPPNRYEGVVIRVSDAPHRRQAGVKIDSRKIEECRKAHGESWIVEMIRECETTWPLVLEPTSVVDPTAARPRISTIGE